MINRFYTSGGIGDVLIVLSKLYKYTQHGQHYVSLDCHSRHECYEKPFYEIIKTLPFISNHSIFVRTDNAETIAKQKAEVDGAYINTKVKDDKYPLMPFIPPIGETFEDTAGYFCVQLVAGRMFDGSLRSVSSQVLRELYQAFPHKKIYLLSPIGVKLAGNIPPNIINITGKTESIIDAFKIINGCSLFVGQDGVLSYYAMMRKKLTVINWHDPRLPMHYMHPEWEDLTVQIIGRSVLECFPDGVINHIHLLLK